MKIEAVEAKRVTISLDDTEIRRFALLFREAGALDLEVGFNTARGAMVEVRRSETQPELAERNLAEILSRDPTQYE